MKEYACEEQQLGCQQMQHSCFCFWQAVRLPGREQGGVVFTLGGTGGGKTQLALGGVDKGVAHPTVHAGGTCLGALQGTEEAMPAVLCV